MGSLSLLQEIFPTQGIPHLQVDSLPAEPPGKPKNTWVGSLPLLREIFLTQIGSPALQADSFPAEPQGGGGGHDVTDDTGII